jgi:hypothetical protein
VICPGIGWKLLLGELTAGVEVLRVGGGVYPVVPGDGEVCRLKGGAENSDVGDPELGDPCGDVPCCPNPSSLVEFGAVPNPEFPLWAAGGAEKPGVGRGDESPDCSPAWLPIWLFIWLPVCLFIWLPVCLSTGLLGE